MSYTFSAVDATLGYQYQVRVALFQSLKKLKQGETFGVSIETLDDVMFETTGGDPTDLLQTKHHKKSAASLSDASSDIWKTLRIWLEGYTSGQILLTTNLFLITTSTVSSGSAASYLKQNGRDVAVARQKLDVTAKTSSSDANTRAYQVYLKEPVTIREDILNRVTIVDGAPDITTLDEDLRSEVFWAVRSENLEPFLQRLEGWWFRMTLKQLTDPKIARIGSVEIESQMSDLRDQFKQEALPIDEDLLDFTLDEATHDMHRDSVFVKQMEIVKAGKKRIASAIRDYFRAFEQRSRWIRDDLVVDVDLRKYEKRLVEEWDIAFEAMRDELGDSATESAKEVAARSVLSWAERTTIPIRPSVTEPFITRGSFHMLSNDQKIGWHPQFIERLETLLSAGGDST